jgi:hypothetical protein
MVPEAEIADAIADAAIETARAVPSEYLPSALTQVSCAQWIVHNIVRWAQGQDQALEALVCGDALTSLAAALRPSGISVIGRVDLYADVLARSRIFKAALGLVETKVVEHERETSAYRCSKCNATGVKLWRQFNAFLDHIELLCAPCAEEDQDKEWDPAKGDQIGRYVPAVPTIDGDTYWGYTSVPPEGVKWWHSLRDRKA